MRGMLSILALASTFASADALAREAYTFKPGRLDSAATITPALTAMPFNDASMGYKNLGERFDRMGLKVKQINVEQLTAADEKDDPQHFKRGDLYIRVVTEQAPAPVLALCPIGTMFHVIKRGTRWIPQDRTGNWLMNGYGHCLAPS